MRLNPLPRIALFMPSFGDGGVGRSMVNLANGFAALGAEVSLIVNQADGVFFDRIRPGVRRIAFRGTRARDLAKELHAFLIEENPHVVMSSHERDDPIAMRVKKLLDDRDGTRFFVRVGTSLATRNSQQRGFWLSKWLQRRTLKNVLSGSDGIIANSEGSARELATFLGIPLARIAVLPNPTLTPDLAGLAEEAVHHPWLEPGQPPVILGIGRLSRIKDFPTLLRAFALLREQRPCRLIVLGQGRQRDKLLRLAEELGVADDFALPGFCKNPYAFLKRASLFALSSLREGCPNVLIEALALGLPSIATDCPNGPREILQDGRYGALVPPGDAEALAAAMADTLNHPPDAAFLREAVRAYTQENSSRAYLEAMGLVNPSMTEKIVP
jgi:glycosyltransferase involved in cell wall biosynthesis